MRFRLVWTDEAVDELTRIYTALLRTGGDTAALARASSRIDQLLESAPLNTGESRSGNRRVTFELPLTVYFEVHEEAQVVVVVRVRFVPPR